jgi:predicted Zn-dependent protease
MGFFKKFFAGASFEDERKEADGLFDRKEFEEARIAYVRALDKKKGAPADAVAHCEARVPACLDAMAEVRIEEAARLLESGDDDLAETELKNAIETAVSKEIVKRAERMLERFEREDAKLRASMPAELTDDDRWSLLMSNWESDQSDEYEDYDDDLRDALLALHEGKGKEAREKLEAILEEAEEPVYLWLEVGRARLAAGDEAAAEEAFREFVDMLEDDEGGNAQLAARRELSDIRDRAGDDEGAIKELELAMDAFPDDPRPFLLMGNHLRNKGHAQEAVEVLEAGVALLDEERPDPIYLQELGLACVAAEEDERAAAYFDRVIAYYVFSVRRNDREPDLPPVSAVERAKLHEKAGELDKAADLYRSLARGSDREHHLEYHLEAARLLADLEMDEEAKRMLTRALALAENAPPEARAAIELRLAELE